MKIWYGRKPHRNELHSLEKVEFKVNLEWACLESFHILISSVGLGRSGVKEGKG